MKIEGRTNILKLGKKDQGKHFEMVESEKEEFFKCPFCAQLIESEKKFSHIPKCMKLYDAYLRRKHFDKIPTDCWGIIIQFLGKETLASLLLTNKYFENVIKEKTKVFVDIKNGKKVELFAFAGKYYLTLKHDNFGTYVLPKRGGWNRFGNTDTSMKTVWYKICVNTKTWKVNTSDYTFSKTTGKITHHNNQPGIAFGTCFDCESPHSHSGTGKIDLRGTPFYVDNTFKHRGYISNGTSKFSHKKQVVDLTGGGYCGWIAPTDATDENKAVVGGEYIQLGIL